PSREREGSETCRDAVVASRSGVGFEGPPEDRPTPDPSRGSPPSRGRVSGGSRGVPTQDWLARGLRHPAGRGWEVEPAVTPDEIASPLLFRGGDQGVVADAAAAAGQGLHHPQTPMPAPAKAGAKEEGAYVPRRLSDAALDARLAEYGVALRPEPGSKPWPGGWLPGDPPVVIDTGNTGDAADPHAASRVFDTARQVRFLDALA